MTWPLLTVTNDGPETLLDVTIDWLPGMLNTASRHRPAWVVFSGGRPHIARLAPGETASIGISPPWVNPSGWVVRARWSGEDRRNHVQDLPIEV